LTTYDVGFVLAPRINAVGRIDNALDALRLLCTGNKELATTLSISMEQLNKDRQELTKSAVDDALKRVGDGKLIVVASHNYHHGVIGLIAGKLAEHTHRPALAMSISGELVKGSARSVTGVNVTELLRRHSGLLLGVGGHEQAAGFSLFASNLDEFVAAVTADASTSISDDLLVNTVFVDLKLQLSQNTIELARALETLEPFGIGNQKPRFVAHNLKVVADRAMGALGNHHKLTVEADGKNFTVLWFNGQSVQGRVKSLVYTLDVNTWQNKSELQLVASYVEI
jgi:single-stranded-DNA-specific exonuclease